MAHTIRGLNAIKSPNGNTLDLENKDLPAGFTMNSVALIDQTTMDQAIADNSVVDFVSNKAVITTLPSYTYDNGGGTITATANGAWNNANSDDVTLSVSDVVLMVDTTVTSGLGNNFEAGLYEVTQLGDGSNPFIFTRIATADESGEWIRGRKTFTESGGTTCENKYWQYQGDSSPTIGTDSLAFVNVGSVTVSEAAVTAHEAALSIATSQLTGSLSNATVAESNVTQHQAALSVASTQLTGTLPDARVAESNVTQHEAALSVAFSQLSDSVTSVSEGAVTAHEAALSISSTQITGLEDGTFILGDTEGTSGSVSAKSIVYIDGSGDVVEAIAPLDDPVFYTVSGMGIAGFPVTVETRPYQVFGVLLESGLTLGSNVNIGDKLYLSDSEAGKLTNSKPSTKARYIGYVVETTGFGKFILDGMASPDTGTQVAYDRADGSKKNIAAASDDIELAINDLDDAIGALDASPANYTPTDAAVVADHLAAIDDEIAGSNKVFITTVNYDSGTPVTLINNAANDSSIMDVWVKVNTAFDGTTPTISVGVAGDTTGIAGTAVFDLETTASNPQTHDTWYKMTATEDVICTLSVSGATQGSCDIAVRRVK